VTCHGSLDGGLDSGRLFPAVGATDVLVQGEFLKGIVDQLYSLDQLIVC
jgi:hypothetical protein